MKRTLSALARISVLASIGCSGKLTRANAQTQLEWQLQHLHFRDPGLTVQAGLVSGYCSDVGNYDPVTEDAKFSVLRCLGMVTIQLTDYPHVSRVVLTEAESAQLAVSLTGIRTKRIVILGK